MELPREKPEAPLRLFAGVPGLRVVAIGGDGTVAWLLGCLEDLGRERAAAGLPWRAPPVGMLPLGTGAPRGRPQGKSRVPGGVGLPWRAPPAGTLRAGHRCASGPTLEESTLPGEGVKAARGARRAAALSAGRERAPRAAGNDLARCLGWGAGMHVLREAGLPGALRDLEHAVPVPLDRWTVKVPRPCSHSPASQRRLVTLVRVRVLLGHPGAAPLPAGLAVLRACGLWCARRGAAVLRVARVACLASAGQRRAPVRLLASLWQKARSCQHRMAQHGSAVVQARPAA